MSLSRPLASGKCNNCRWTRVAMMFPDDDPGVTRYTVTAGPVGDESKMCHECRIWCGEDEK